MTKRILLSLMTIGLVMSVAVVGTQALFSDTETSSGNTFTAGSIDLQIDYDGYYNKEVGGTPNAGDWGLHDLSSGEKFFDFVDLKPGDYGEGTISLHVFNNDAYCEVTITRTEDDDNGLTEPESDVDQTDGAGNGELDEYLYFTIWADDGDNKLDQGEEILTEGYVSEIGDGVTWPLDMFEDDGTLLGSHTYYLGIAWEIPFDTGNAIQSDSYAADISFYCEQARHNSPQ